MRVSCSRRDFVQKAGWAGFGLVCDGCVRGVRFTACGKGAFRKAVRIGTLGTGASDHDWARSAGLACGARPAR